MNVITLSPTIQEVIILAVIHRRVITHNLLDFFNCRLRGKEVS